MATQAQADDFDVAKGIFDQLKDLPTERQQRILRWIAESLGVTSVVLSRPAAQGGDTHTPPAASVPPAAVPTGPTDIKSFIAAKSPKSDRQFAAAVAYFYRFEAPPAERRDSIDGNVLQEAARLAGRKRLTSPRVTLNNAKAAGYLDGVAPGEFAINSVGENLVAMTLPGGAEVPTRTTKAAKSRKKAKSAPKKR